MADDQAGSAADGAATPEGSGADMPPVSSSDMMAEVSKAIAGLSGGERILALGAAAIAGAYLVFWILLEVYSFSRVLLLVAAIALFAVWVRQSRPDAAWPVPAWWVARTLGYTAGFLGLVELISDLRTGYLDRFADTLGGLIVYAGAFLMFWGARQTQKS